MRRTNRDRRTRSKITNKLKEFQERIGIQFQNEKLLMQAFTHSSYVNEHRKKPHEDNERLEFLGDAVLELTVSQYLFMKYPLMSEGELTKLRAAIVCEPSLVTFANELEFGETVLLGKGEEMTGGRNSTCIASRCIRGVYRGIYLEQGLETTILSLKKLFTQKWMRVLFLM